MSNDLIEMRFSLMPRHVQIVVFSFVTSKIIENIDTVSSVNKSSLCSVFVCGSEQIFNVPTNPKLEAYLR